MLKGLDLHAQSVSIDRGVVSPTKSLPNRGGGGVEIRKKLELTGVIQSYPEKSSTTGLSWDISRCQYMASDGLVLVARRQ